MKLRYAFLQNRSFKNFVPKFIPLAEFVFNSDASQSWIDGLEWRLLNMPDVTIFSAYDDADLVGFKIGYATAYDRYYSWLGGVHPDYQRRGIASELTLQQHSWLSQSRFTKLETQLSKTNKAMFAINKKSGFVQTGQFQKNGEPYLIMEKSIAF